MAHKKQQFNYYRLLIQWAILVLIFYLIYDWKINLKDSPDFEKYCPFGGIQSLLSFLKNNILACSMSSVQIAMGITLLISVLIFSKLFCGYLCPIGTITEWIGKIGNKFKILFTVKGLPDKLLRLFKYALLFVTVYYTVTTGELFCKKYDPYFALTTWFSYDVNFYLAVASIAITIIGSIFIRQFWCKYLCPLGAISNLFSYFFAFLFITLIYITLLYFNYNINWVYYFLTVLFISYLLEAFNFNRIVFPIFKITRNDDVCTHCKLCDKSCPQGIPISGSNTKIKHIDCNLCGNCLTVCPTYKSIGINHRRMSWLPAFATIILVCIALYFSKIWEIPTVNERWGTKQEFESALIFKKSGLKDIKCYGSCMSFVSQMRNIKGVLGVEAYVNSHSVKIYYNPKIITEKQIAEAIFYPVVNLIKNPPDDVNEVSMVTMHVNKFFDSYDNFYITKLFEKQDGIFGYKTQYGEPVIFEIYFNPRLLNTGRIKNIIESKSVSYQFDNKNNIQEINFEVSFIDKSVKTMNSIDFKHSMFIPFNSSFNNFSKYDKTKLAIYQIEMPDAAFPDFVDRMPYLVNHLSKDPWIVEFSTKFEGNIPFAEISYVTDKTDANKIYNLLLSDSLHITYDNGELANEKNPFNFKKEGIIKEIYIDSLKNKE